VFVVENLLTKELKAAHATRLSFYSDKELHVTAELSQAAEHNYHQLYVVSKILDARYNEQENVSRVVGRLARFPCWRGHLTTLLSGWLWMFRRWWRSSWSLTTIQTWCARCNLFESSRGEVLCDATNKTSVSDMLCRDNKEVCKHCRVKLQY
jgi:hypothetical protein